MSATLNDTVQALKELVLHNPVSIRGIVLPGSKTLRIKITILKAETFRKG